MIRQLRALVRKDLKTFRSDRRAVIVSFALPALLALLFGLAFRGERGERELHISSRIVDLDGSPASKRIVEGLAKDPILATQPAAQTEVEELVRKGKIAVGIIIPEGFAARAAAANKGASSDRPAIALLGDPTSRMESGIAQGILSRAVTQALGPDLGADFVRCADTAPPYTAEIRAVTGGDPTYDGASHALAGMGVQFILVGAVDAAVRMLEERQRGLFRRLRAAPLSRVVLIGSRLVSGALVALAVVLFLYAFGSVTMGVHIQGSQVGFGLVAVTFALMASALGVLIATFGKTPQATRGVGIFVVLLATMLSGAWLPSFLFPKWMQTATLFVPSRWAVDGFDAMTWRGLPLEDALVPAGVLLLSALVLGALAAARFRWDE